MTLVATSRSAGVPILLGDFLISQGATRRRGRKKITRLRNTLAIGWTGTLVHATGVIRRINAELSDSPTQEELALWLANYDPGLANQQSLKLIGWIADGDDPVGFHWDGSAPEVHWGDDWCVGTGGRAYEVFSKSYMVHRDPNGPQEREALEWLVGLLTHLNCGDMLTQEGHEIGVGGGYEALYWSFSERRFKYVEDVMYFLVACRMDRDGHFR